MRECPPPTPSKRAALFSQELVLEQKHYNPITDVSRMTPFTDDTGVILENLTKTYIDTGTAFGAQTS